MIETIQDGKIPDEEKVKLSLLLALKYSDDKERVSGLIQSMKKRTLRTDHVEKVLLGAKMEGRKSEDLFSLGSKIFKSYAAEIVTKLKDFKDSPHYFERHKPRF